jgi:hypothetical protein
MRYRIDVWKFWTWVGVSVAFGVLVGLGFSYVAGTGTRTQISELSSELTTAKAESAKAAQLQAQLASAEASVTTLTAQNSRLVSGQAAGTGGAGSAVSESSETSATLAVLSRVISPSTVSTSGSITMTVKVQGHPDSVKMRLMGPDSTSTYRTYTLTRASQTDTGETWRLKVEAPSEPGVYRYYATAAKGSTSVTKVGASPSKLTVE